MNEFDIISWIRERTSVSESVTLGPGDDCAVISPGNRDIAVSTDSLAEGVHFTPGTDPYRIGWKAAASSLSDIAAAGCEPAAVFAASQIPSGRPGGFIKELFRGLEDVCGLFSIPVAGGDLTLSKGGVCITVTSIGFVPPEGMLLRSGASCGDAVFVTGLLGDSLSGRHLEFIPRIKESLKLRECVRISSMIDISDGLYSELRHISRESGVGMDIDVESIPVSPGLTERYGAGSKEAVIHALCDGEDYELLFTLPADQAETLSPDLLPGVPLTRIGMCREGKGGDVVFQSDSVTIMQEDLKPFSHEF